MSDDPIPRILILVFCLFTISFMVSLPYAYGTNTIHKESISGYFKPSSAYDSSWSYRWHQSPKWLNYCPACHHYNCLGVWKYCPEKQISCYNCDCDYSGLSGYEKMPSPRWRLMKYKSISKPVKKKAPTKKALFIQHWKGERYTYPNW